MESSVFLRCLLMAWKFDLNNYNSFVSYKVCISCPVKILTAKDWKPCSILWVFWVIAGVLACSADC